MKLMAVIPIWKRENITRLALDWYKKHQCEIVVVGSEGDRSELLAKGLHYVEADNHPLDAKYDAGFAYCRKFNPDAVTLIGSDDFITEDYFDWAKAQIKVGCDVVGLLDFYLVDIQARSIHYWGGYTNNKIINEDRTGDSIGAGRVFSRSVLEEVDWQPFLTDGKYLDCYKDDERVINNLHDPFCKSINMANIGCRYWALKTGNEINRSKAFHECYDNLVNVTKFTKGLLKKDLGIDIDAGDL